MEKTINGAMEGFEPYSTVKDPCEDNDQRDHAVQPSYHVLLLLLMASTSPRRPFELPEPFHDTMARTQLAPFCISVAHQTPCLNLIFKVETEGYSQKLES